MKIGAILRGGRPFKVFRAVCEQGKVWGGAGAPPGPLDWGPASAWPGGPDFFGGPPPGPLDGGPPFEGPGGPDIFG